MITRGYHPLRNHALDPMISDHSMFIDLLDYLSYQPGQREKVRDNTKGKARSYQ